jgi:tRNA nucleotidyltransferase (CCA-adding enzyme)
MKLNEVLKEEIEKISPSKSEILELKKIASNLISSLKVNGIDSFLGGSLAKGTLIKGSEKRDVDIFALFSESGDISKLGEVLRKIDLPGKLKKVRGSRDYFQIVNPDIVLEVIPVVKSGNATVENVTDFSLSHVRYVKDEIRKNPKLSDEIRLAKAFCKANRVYGAESYIHGFSGYSLEVLIVYFGSFVKFLKGIEKEKAKVIDPAKHFRNRNEVMRELNESKISGPIVLVDPMHKYRNICAGLRYESFDKFNKVSREFLKSPSLDFFEKKDIDVEELKRFASSKKARLVKIELKTDRQEGDIAGTKMKKFFDYFSLELMRKQQKILLKEFFYSGEGKTAIAYLVLLESLEIEVRGPPVKMIEPVMAFKKAKGSKAFLKKGYYWYKEKVSLEGIMKDSQKVMGEMGACGKIV